MGIPVRFFFRMPRGSTECSWSTSDCLYVTSDLEQGFNKGNTSGIFSGLWRHSDFLSGPEWSYNHSGVTLFSYFSTSDVSWNVYGFFFLRKDTGGTLQKSDIDTPGIFGWLYDIPGSVKSEE